jgi:transposase InsO family protein
MTERLAFIQACLDRRERIVDLCIRFGISEKTGQKWLARFRTEGLAGLAERTHAPHRPRCHVAPALAARIIALRQRYPKYGALKLYDWLVQHEPATPWPVPSTIGALLARHGLVRSRRHRPHGQHAALTIHSSGRTAAAAPNDVWTADFKGEFRLTNTAWCYPLSALDLCSHYLLQCRALAGTRVAPAQAVFADLFREYGLPRVLRTDNGVPFAQANALGRLGALGYWLVRLGIRPEHIEPGKPAQNGAHERFHKTLKAATLQPRAASLRAQQARFDRFQQEYNRERPHASLPGHRPPASVYSASPRPYPARLPPVLYPEGSDVRLVMSGGSIRWRNELIFLTTNLRGQYVLLTETPAALFTVQYAQLALGEVDPDTKRFTPRVRWID